MYNGYRNNASSREILMENKYGHAHFWLPWLGFFIVWGGVARFFENAEMYAPGWWFNTGGHTVFGVWCLLSRCFLIHHPRYMPYPFSWKWPKIFVAYAKRKPMQCLFRATVTWEITEFLYDIFIYPLVPEWGKAQKGWLDTYIDVLVANLSGYGTLQFIKLGLHHKIKSIFPLFRFFGFTAKRPAEL